MAKEEPVMSLYSDAPSGRLSNEYRNSDASSGVFLPSGVYPSITEDISRPSHTKSPSQTFRMLPRQRYAPWFEVLSSKSTLIKLSTLFCFYACQGLPFGFQSNTYSLILRSSGTSRTLISLTQLLSLPWILKPLWAPIIDAHPNQSRVHWISRRYYWLVPQVIILSITLFVSSSIAGSGLSLPSKSLAALGGTIAFQNFLCASMDISVDGLAVDLLTVEELGFGNAVQVVAYKIGILVGGGLMAYFLTPDWSKMLIIVSILVLVTAACGMSLAECLLKKHMREPVRNEDDTAKDRAPSTTKGVWSLLAETLFRRDQIWIVLAILLYKSGEVIGDRMFKLFLYDYGYSIQDISLYIGSFGDGMSIIGSLFGAFVVKKFNGPFALMILAIFIVCAQFLRLCLAIISTWRSNLTAVVLVEVFVELSSGAITTVMFSFMMSQVDHRIGASHYSVYAVLEVIGKGIPDFLSGYLTDQFGYPLIFLLSVVFEGLFVLVTIKLLFQWKKHADLPLPQIWSPYPITSTAV